MESSHQRELIQARRTPLENEKYAAELDLKLAKESEDKALHQEPKKRLDEIQAKLDLLDKEESKLKD